MAKRTIIVGINQTTMAALSMATIAAFINGPGLGQPVVRPCRRLRVGDAFVPGICIVLMAIMLDRMTTAASEHGEKLRRGQARDMAARRNLFLLMGAAVTIVCVYMSQALRLRREAMGVIARRQPVRSGADTAIDWISTTGPVPPARSPTASPLPSSTAGVRAGAVPLVRDALGILALASSSVAGVPVSPR